jgi:hypothetical protein
MTPTTTQDHSDDPLEAAVQRNIDSNTSVLTPWQPPVRNHYHPFNYKALQQRLHSAAARAQELTPPSVYFRFLQDRDSSVREIATLLETSFHQGLTYHKNTSFIHCQNILLQLGCLSKLRLPASRSTSMTSTECGNYTYATCHAAPLQQCRKQATANTIGRTPPVKLAS